MSNEHFVWLKCELRSPRFLCYVSSSSVCVESQTERKLSQTDWREAGPLEEAG